MEDRKSFMNRGTKTINDGKVTYFIFSRENWFPMEKFSKNTTNRPHINSWTILCCPEQQLWGSAQNENNWFSFKLSFIILPLLGGKPRFKVLE